MSIQKILDNKLVYLILGLLVFLVTVPLIIQNFDTQYNSNCPTLDIDETVMFQHSITFEETGSDFNVSINKPDDSTFESAILVENSVERIVNNTNVIEDNLQSTKLAIKTQQPLYSSFVKENGTINAISVYISQTQDEGADLGIYILTSAFNGTDIYPNQSCNASTLVNTISVLNTDIGWLNTTQLNFEVNSQLTYNNTWFIALKQNSAEADATLNWYYSEDGSANGGDSDNEAICYKTLTSLKLLLFDFLIIVNESINMDVEYTITSFDNDATNHIDLEFIADSSFTLNATVTIYLYADYDITQTSVENCQYELIEVEVDFDLDDNPLYINITYSNSFTYVWFTFDDGYETPDFQDTAHVDLTGDEGDYVVNFSKCCIMSDLYTLLPVFIIIAIVICGIFVIYQKKTGGW